ncbi:acyltransferase family protein [Bradyrhizobium sp. SYSU BS000235]|uniref:acyltransferase family protein n=1 Tax=Bradyrhizobium sp. SYSU BS000235 TaxID=3411332 RepID=UPI003C78F6F1
MTERNQSLDGLRGIAVILTFLVHYCGAYLTKFRGGNPNEIAFAGWSETFDKVLYWLFHSHHGVYIFFLLSGFLIARIVSNEGFDYRNFVVRRVKRIYPAFLLVLAACLFITALAKGTFPGWINLAENLIFLNGAPGLNVPGIVFNNVTWSLFYEMTFYLAFPIVLAMSRAIRTPALLTAMIAGVLVPYAPMYMGVYSEFYLFLFAGAIIGLLPLSKLTCIARLIPDAAVILFYLTVTSLATLNYLTATQFIWLFSAAGMVILCKAITGTGVIARMLSFQPLVRLGRISYSFYLVHSIALIALLTLSSRIWIPILGPIGNAIYLGLAGFAASLAMGWASYMIAERSYFKDRESLRITQLGMSLRGSSNQS